MSLFVIGDLHLSLSVDKPMDVFGGAWQNYEEKIAAGFEKISQDDTVILLGDLSWGLNFDEACEDFKFIGRLPGRKLIVKGNHDYWWSTAAKVKRQLCDAGITGIEILHNTSFMCENTALCGTRGWFFEEEKSAAHDEKILNRELGRLKSSFDHAAAQNPQEIICFLHYPPLYEGYRCDAIVDLMNEYGVRRCYYGHLHGAGRERAIEGLYKGIDYRLVSADHVNFEPAEVVL